MVYADVPMKMILKHVFHRLRVGSVQKRSASSVLMPLVEVYPRRTEVAGNVDHEVEELRFERDAGDALERVKA